MEKKGFGAVLVELDSAVCELEFLDHNLAAVYDSALNGGIEFNPDCLYFPCSNLNNILKEIRTQVDKLFEMRKENKNGTN